MELSDILGIIDVIITLFVGFWLTRYVGNRDSMSRVLKDYYIEEAKDLQYDVRTFFARLLSNHVPGNELARWYKSHMNKFKSFDKNIRETFPIECLPVSDELFKLHNQITSLDEFNNGFTTGAFNFSPINRTKINELECSALTLLNDYVVQVNNSPGHGYIMQTAHELKHEYEYYIYKMHDYFHYVLQWIWRLIKLGIFVGVIYFLSGYCNTFYKSYTIEKQKEKQQLQKNVDRALESIAAQNARLDSLDLDLRMIKDNMRVRKGVNNYWIHTNCSEGTDPAK